MPSSHQPSSASTAWGRESEGVVNRCPWGAWVELGSREEDHTNSQEAHFGPSIHILESLELTPRSGC